MRIGGKKIECAPATEIVVFPREEGDIAFKAVALLDRTEFDKYCPLPKPPKKRVKGGVLVDNPEDPRFQKSLEGYNKDFMDFMVIASLYAPGEKEGDPDQRIEWEKVERVNRATWYLWDQELQDAGFSDMERKRIYNIVASVNSLNDAKLDEARNSFLQRQREMPEESSSQTDEQNDTPSGEPASDSE